MINISLGSMCWVKMFLKQKETIPALPFDNLNAQKLENVVQLIRRAYGGTLCYKTFCKINEANFNPYGCWMGHYNPPPSTQTESNEIVFKRRFERLKEILKTESSLQIIYYNRENHIYQTHQPLLKELHKITGKSHTILYLDHFNTSENQNKKWLKTYHLNLHEIKGNITNEHFNDACRKHNLLP